ncbi:hypothetical protein GEMRC1_001351 [Eukaryota sp. GEM-RC1]
MNLWFNHYLYFNGSFDRINTPRFSQNSWMFIKHFYSLSKTLCQKSTLQGLTSPEGSILQDSVSASGSALQNSVSATSPLPEKVQRTAPPVIITVEDSPSTVSSAQTGSRSSTPPTVTTIEDSPPATTSPSFERIFTVASNFDIELIRYRNIATGQVFKTKYQHSLFPTHVRNTMALSLLLNLPNLLFSQVILNL